MTQLLLQKADFHNQGHQEPQSSFNNTKAYQSELQQYSGSFQGSKVKESQVTKKKSSDTALVKQEYRLAIYYAKHVLCNSLEYDPSQASTIRKSLITNLFVNWLKNQNKALKSAPLSMMQGAISMTIKNVFP